MSQVAVTRLVRTASVRPSTRPRIDAGRVARRALGAVIVVGVVAAAWLGLLPTLAGACFTASSQAAESGAAALGISTGALVLGLVACALVVSAVLAAGQRRVDAERPQYDVR